MAYPIIRHTILPLVMHQIRYLEGFENIPEHGTFIVAANHVSFIEPALLAMLVVRRTHERVYSLTKYSIWRMFQSLGVAAWLGMVPVEPSNPHHCIERCVQHLRQGSPVLIFPEGGRNYNQELLRAKTGVAQLALRTGLPVVPVGYIGPSGKTTPESIKNFLSPKVPIEVRIGKPLVFPAVQQESITREDLRRTADAVMRGIAPLCKKTYPY